MPKIWSLITGADDVTLYYDEASRDRAIIETIRGYKDNPEDFDAETLAQMREDNPDDPNHMEVTIDNWREVLEALNAEMAEMGEAKYLCELKEHQLPPHLLVSAPAPLPPTTPKAEITLKQRLWVDEAFCVLGIGRSDILDKGFERARRLKLSPLVAACSVSASGYAVNVRGNREEYDVKEGKLMARRLLAENPKLGNLTLDDIISPKEELHIVVAHSLNEDGSTTPRTVLETKSYKEAIEAVFSHHVLLPATEDNTDIYSVRTETVSNGEPELIQEKYVAADGSEFSALEDAIQHVAPGSSPSP